MRVLAGRVGCFESAAHLEIESVAKGWYGVLDPTAGDTPNLSPVLQAEGADTVLFRPSLWPL